MRNPVQRKPSHKERRDSTGLIQVGQENLQRGDATKATASWLKKEAAAST